MESWDHIINTALLGTDKRPLRKEDVEPDLSHNADALFQNTQSNEEAFLQTAAMAYNYRRCGFLPWHKEVVTIATAGAEEKGYASTAAHQALYGIMDAGSNSLLRFWLQQCAGRHTIVQPEVIPVLLDAGIRQKQIQSLVGTCCGKRGAWLMQFNDNWKKYTAITSDNDAWQTGTPEQRKNFLAEVRRTDREKGRELLQQVWPQESAAVKTELLHQLWINAGNEDVPWLELLLNEKSAKVKDEALHILKLIPGSSVVQSYWNLLRNSIKIVTSKGLLGFGAKSHLTIKLVEVDKAIFKTGIAPLPAEKGVTEESFILSQLIGGVPPNFWEGHLNLDKKKILEIFSKDENGKALVPAFGIAAAQFHDAEWMKAVIAFDEELFYTGALRLLPQNEAERYALRFLNDDNHAATVLRNIDSLSDEWSVAFAKALLHYTAKNPYQYHRGFYNEIAHLLPVPVVAELEKCTPKEGHLRSMWNNLSDHITRLLTLKSETRNAFNE